MNDRLPPPFRRVHSPGCSRREPLPDEESRRLLNQIQAEHEARIQKHLARIEAELSERMKDEG